MRSYFGRYWKSDLWHSSALLLAFAAGALMQGDYAWGLMWLTGAACWMLIGMAVRDQEGDVHQRRGSEP